jgi:PAS domain S-box-containing protein
MGSSETSETGLAPWASLSAEQLLESCPDGFVSMDSQWRITYVNSATERINGQRREDLLGRDHWEVYPAAVGTSIYLGFLQVMEERKPLRIENYYEPWDRWFELDAFPTPDGGIATYYRDVTEHKLAEAEIRRKQAELTDFVENAVVALHWVGPDGTILWANQAELDLLGYTREEYIGRNIAEFHADQSVIEDILCRLSSGGELNSYGARLLRKDGSVRHVLISSNVYRENGAFRHTRCFTRDITDMKRAEEQLREARNRLEAALEAATVGIWSWDVVNDRLAGDRNFARMFSLSPEEAATGLPLSRYLPRIHPDDVAPVTALVEQAVATGGRYAADYRIVSPEGSVRWVEVRGRVYRDDAGQPSTFPGVMTDITERKRVEQELGRVSAESERLRRLYETILSNTPDLAYVFDLDHRFLYANEGLLETWGLTWDEAIGKTCLELGYEPWHAEMHDREIEQVKATKEAVRGEVPFAGTFGRRIYEYIFVPVIGEDGEVEAVAGTTRDVTVRKQTEEALREADRRKDQFLATLAHELRNPLAPISNALHIWPFVEHDPVETGRVRDMMGRQVDQLIRLIDDLLDVSRISRGKIELRKERLDLATILEGAIEAVQPLVDGCGHELTVVLPAEPVAIEGDVGRLMQVFGNLLNNAAKYSGRNGRIRIVAARQGNEVVISVQDEGPGIPPEMLEAVFEMFVQVDQTLDRAHGGLGIGLTLVKNLVELHGGTVEAKSDGPGRGSEFVVRLPVLTGDLTQPAAEAKSAPRPSLPLPGCRVLVVDDVKPSADTLSMMLAGLGQEIRIAYDGWSALAVAEEFCPDVAFLDIAMPEMDGYEVAKRLRQISGCRPVLVALTGYGQEEDRRRALEAGFDHHLVKPASLDALRQLLMTVSAEEARAKPEL